MKKILLVTHGQFCEGIKSSLDVIISDSSMVDTIAITVSESPDEIKEKIKNYIDTVDEKTPIFIITDIPAGSTTTNAANFVPYRENIHLVTGLNLGMLLAIALQPVEEGNVKENIHSILEEAKNTIVYVNDMFSQN